MATFSNFFRANTDDGSILTQVINTVTATGDGNDNGSFFPAKNITVTVDFGAADPGPSGGTAADGALLSYVEALAAVTSGVAGTGKLYLFVELVSTDDPLGVFITTVDFGTITAGAQNFHNLVNPGDNLILPIQIDTAATAADTVPGVVVGNATGAAQTSVLSVAAYYQAD